MKLKTFFLKTKKTFLGVAFVLGSTYGWSQTNVFDDIIAISPDHTYLAAALQQEGLDVALQDPGSTYTVFAPTNAALDNLAATLNTDIAGLLALPNLSDVLLYHVLGVQVTSANVNNGAIVSPLSPSNTLKLTKTSGNEVFVNQAKVNAADLLADNGVVHSIDAVLVPLETVADIAINYGFTYLVAAVSQQELLPALTDPFASLTVFAPSNQAFDNLATALNTDIAGLLALPNLTDVLLYHVLGTQVNSASITNGTIVNPLSTTNSLKLTLTGAGDVYVNHAKVTTVDLNASNGTVHVLDAVVLPVETVADIALDNGFSTLVTAVVQEELLPALTNPFATFTIFAPTNGAFDNLATALNTNISGILALPNLTDVLLYHALNTEVPSSAITNGAIVTPLGSSNTLKITKTATGDVFVNQAKVTSVDITASNGIVHVIDAVVLPVETVADIAIDNGFTTLVTAVVQEELLPALTNPFANLTVFAPTNTAFNNLANALGTDLAGILALPNLTQILLYHVLGTEVLSTALTNGPVTTLSGQMINVDITSGVKINNANVTTADILSDNGVVHVIDAVLVPGGVGVDNSQNEISLSLYPNPSNQFIRIENSFNGMFEIFDLNGKKSMTGNLQNQVIDISALPAGTYIFRMNNENKIGQSKFVKM